MSLIVQAELCGTWAVAPKVYGIGVGPFIVFEGTTGWNLTHKASGLAVLTRGCCVVRVVLVAEAISPLTDWSKSANEMRGSKESAMIRQVIKDTPCPRGAHGGE